MWVALVLINFKAIFFIIEFKDEMFNIKKVSWDRSDMFVKVYERFDVFTEARSYGNYEREV